MDFYEMMGWLALVLNIWGNMLLAKKKHPWMADTSSLQRSLCSIFCGIFNLATTSKPHTFCRNKYLRLARMEQKHIHMRMWEGLRPKGMPERELSLRATYCGKTWQEQKREKP